MQATQASDNQEPVVSESDKPIIRLEGISKVFPGDEIDTHALREIHLEILKGEYVCVAGPSGCGKTTLLSVIGLLDTPTDGTYALEGRRIDELSAADRAAIRNQKIGFIFQSFNLIGDMTVAENISLPLSYRGWSARRRAQRVKEALGRVGLAHRASHMPNQLSGGQQQRVAVARAVAGEPRILLADEPTGNLDTANGEAVMEILRDLHASGSTICMVTHNPDYARQAEREISLLDGRIVEEQRREHAA